jgi:hypothetical protein
VMPYKHDWPSMGTLLKGLVHYWSGCGIPTSSEPSEEARGLPYPLLLTLPMTPLREATPCQQKNRQDHA